MFPCLYYRHVHLPGRTLTHKQKEREATDLRFLLSAKKSDQRFAIR